MEFRLPAELTEGLPPDGQPAVDLAIRLNPS